MASEMINDLTEEQEALLDVYAERWTRIGLATGPAIRDEAEAAICDVYAVAGLARPEVRFVRGPLELRDAIGGELVDSCIYGNHDAGWLAFYAYMREVLGLVEETEEFVPLIRLAHVANWVGVVEGLAVISDHPEYIRLDPLGRLHCLDGPALRYADGLEVYSWHGVDLSANPRPLLEPHTITEVEVLEEQNTERRRALMYLYGPERLASKMQEVQRDSEGRLLQFGDERWVEVINGTPNPLTGKPDIYLLPTLASVTSAREAVAASYEMAADEYRPDLRV